MIFIIFSLTPFSGFGLVFGACKSDKNEDWTLFDDTFLPSLSEPSSLSQFSIFPPACVHMLYFTIWFRCRLSAAFSLLTEKSSAVLLSAHLHLPLVPYKWLHPSSCLPQFPAKSRKAGLLVLLCVSLWMMLPSVPSSPRWTFSSPVTGFLKTYLILTSHVLLFWVLICQTLTTSMTFRYNKQVQRAQSSTMTFCCEA